MDITHLYDREAEVAVISEAVLEAEHAARALSSLVPDDFFNEAYRLIWEGITELFAHNRQVDYVMLCSWVKDHDKSDERLAFRALIDSANTRANFTLLDSYIETIKAKAAARRFLRSLREAEARLLDGEAPKEVICQTLERGSAILGDVDRSQDEQAWSIAARVGDEIEERCREHQGGLILPGVTSGIPRLDRLTCGWGRRQPYIIIAARPSVGKTTFALNQAFAATGAGYKVRFHSIEMDKESLAEMSLAYAGGIENLRLRTGALRDDDWDKISVAHKTLQGTCLVVDDTPEITVQQIRARTQRQIMDVGCDLLIVDYLQLIKGNGKYRSHYDEVTDVSHQLRHMGRALRVPMVILSQLNREIEQRGGKKAARPRLSDIRETGAIEQDADIVAFLYDPDPPDEEIEVRPAEGPIKLYVAKQRRGQIGTVDLVFNRNYCLFRQGAG